MTEVRYIGMTFVYPKDNDKWDLIKSKAKIVEILVRKYECVSGYYVSKIGGVYLEGDKVMGWRYKKDVEYEDIPYYLDEDVYEIVWTESMEKGIEEVRKYEHWERLGKRIECVAFKSFPPKKYLNKHNVLYNRDRPAFPLGQLEGPEVWVYTPELWYTYKGNKDFISLDFGTYEKYFYSEDEKLNKAMEEFLVDLMREIAMETEPEYAYMDLDEYRPLEMDRVCENGKLRVDYYISYKGELEFRCYLPPLLYLDDKIIEKNGGERFRRYMETKNMRREIWGIERVGKGVFYHIGDIVIPVDRPQRSYLEVSEHLLGDKIDEIKRKIKGMGDKEGYICEY